MSVNKTIGPLVEIFQAYFRTNYVPNFAKKIVCLQLYDIENICEIPLSETRNYTLIEVFYYLRCKQQLFELISLSGCAGWSFVSSQLGSSKIAYKCGCCENGCI